VSEKQSRPQNALDNDHWNAIPLRSLRRHAEQLATHLSSLGNDLDRREAELAAEQARRDGEFRAARLWVAARVANLHDLIGQLGNQVRQMRNATSPLSSNTRTVSSNQADLHLVSIEQQLQTLELALADYQSRVVDMGDLLNTIAAEATSKTKDDSTVSSSAKSPAEKKALTGQAMAIDHAQQAANLAQQTTALDFRARAIESARQELAATYQETKELHDSTEMLLHRVSEQRMQQPVQVNSFSDNSLKHHPLAVQTQVLEEAEQRLRKVHAQMIEERKELVRLKTAAPSAWEEERKKMLQQIDLLQAALHHTQQKTGARKAA